MNQPKNKGGRPTKYNEEMVNKILDLASKGLTEASIAKECGISYEAIFDWKEKYPEFLQALKKAKDASDGAVVESLRMRALGFTRMVEKYNPKTGETFTVEEYFPPDPTSMIFWLKNRQRQQWTDVQRREHTGADGAPIETAPQIVITLPDNGRSAK